jgi:hypothetical protein
LNSVPSEKEKILQFPTEEEKIEIDIEELLFDKKGADKTGSK